MAWVFMEYVLPAVILLGLFALPICAVVWYVLAPLVEEEKRGDS